MAQSVTGNDWALLRAMATYLRRHLGDTAEVAEVPPGSPPGPLPGSPAVAVVGGERSWMWERKFTRKTGLAVRFRGSARVDPRRDSGLPFAIWDDWDPGEEGEPPDDFEVLAVVTTYNEAEIIEQLLDRLLADGVNVHVVDNWSTDGTEKLVGDRADGRRVRLERWPADGPSQYFDLQGLLRKVEQVAHASGADWVMHHDADEIHSAPWPGVPLRRALWAVERWGFNAIDHSGLDFRPVDNRWQPTDDLAESFEWFEFGTDGGYFGLIKGWKPQPEPVELILGGIEASFPGRRVFPYKFVIRHYPIRSQDHGRRKILRERLPRWNPEEKAKGWHVHYDHFNDDSSFVWDPAGLHRWDQIDERLLVQRLSGAGLPGNPRPDETVPLDNLAGE